MSSSSRNQRGLTLLIGLCCLGLVLAATWWLNRPTERNERRVDVPSGIDRVATGPSDALAGDDMITADRQASGAAHDTLVIDGLVIPVGVRLAGDGKLSGRVLERGSGRAVGGARVDLWGIPPTGTEFLGRILDIAGFQEESVKRVDPVATQVSGPDGSFAFDGIRKGRYFLEARGARHVADAVESVMVTKENAITDAELFVRPGGRIVGRVLDPSGHPVSGAEVFAAPGPGTFIREASNGDLRVGTARTRKDGSFIVAGLPPGDGYDLTAVSSKGALSHVLALTVLAGEDTVCDLRLSEGGRVRGRVVVADAEAAEGDDVPAAKPVVGAYVGVVPRGFRDLHFAREVMLSTYAVTDANGEYVLTGIPRGSHDVVAVAEALRPTLGPRVDVVDGVESTADDLVLKDGPRVRVHVTNAAGDPLAGVVASWWVMDWNDFEFDFSMTPFMLQGVEGFFYPETDAEGYVTVGPFGTGERHNFILTKPGIGMKSVRWNPEKDGDEIEVTMTPPAAIEGLVMDADEAKPVTQFTLSSNRRIEPQAGAPAPFNPYSGGVVIENPRGQFRLEPMRAGKVDLSVRAPGYVPVQLEDIEVAEGETKRGVIVRMRKGGVVRGRVENAEGEPVGGAQVMAATDKGDPAFARFSRSPRLEADSFEAEINQEFGAGMMDVASQVGVLGPGTVVSDAEGNFELNGLPPGTYEIVAKHRNYAGAKKATISVPEAGTVEDAVVVLERGGRLLGTISDRYDRAVPGAIVIAFNAGAMTDGPRRGPAAFLGSRGLHQGQSDVEGNYVIPNLPGGSYFVTVTRGDEQLNLMSFLGTLNFDLVSVAPEGDTRFDVLDSSMGGVRVYGRITENGEPVGRGGLFALNFESENLLGVDAKIAEVTKEGTFEFAGLLPGDYRITYGGNRRSDATFEIEVLDVPEQRLDLEMPSSRIVGRVVSPDGQPVSRAWLRATRMDKSRTGTGLLGSLISGEGQNKWTNTDEDGRFEFEGLSAGTYEVQVGSVGRRGNDESLVQKDPRTVELGDRDVSAEIIFELEPALVLTGKVTDEFGKPVERARVRAWRADSENVRSRTDRTNAEGEFEVEGLARAVYEVGVEAKDFAQGSTITVDLSEGAVAPLALVVERGTELVVWVTDGVGRPVAGATARVDPVEGRSVPRNQQAERVIEGFFRGEGVSDETGKLELGRFGEGSWKIEVLATDRRGVIEASLTGERTEVEVEVSSQ